MKSPPDTTATRWIAPLVVALLLIGVFFGVDVRPLLNTQAGPITASGEITAADQERAEFVSVTLADTEEVWARLFRGQLSRTYTPATLVLFKGATASACGSMVPWLWPMGKKRARRRASAALALTGNCS